MRQHVISDERPLRLLNWNIQAGGGGRVPQILAAIGCHSPTIAVITEYRTGLSGSALRDGLSRLGLTHQRAASAEHNRNTVLVASAHPLDTSPLAVPEAISRHVLSVRVRNIDLIAAFCANDDIGRPFVTFLTGLLPYSGEVLALGDFLYGPRGQDPNADRALKPALRAGWVDTLRSGGKPDPGWSFQTTRGKSSPDYLLVSQGLAGAVESVRFSEEELAQGLSDHAPLIATLNTEVCDSGLFTRVGSGGAVSAVSSDTQT